MQRVLFISPTWMDIYKDIMGELEKQGYEVDFIADKSFQEDPYKVWGKKTNKCFLRTQRENFFRRKDIYWEAILETPQYNHNYDYLFVVDGQSVSPMLFSTVKDRNPKVKCINYLFDTTKGVYEFNRNFQYFDKIFTFDFGESKKYNVEFLPIYWVETDTVKEYEFDLFGLGQYSKPRYELFEFLDNISKREGLKSYIKLQLDARKNFRQYKIKYAIRRMLGLANKIIPPQAFLSELCTNTKIPPIEFRQYICKSMCVIDTSPSHQDGLTARFMWALGAGRKIITTNKLVKEYDFYSPKQIYVVDSIADLNNDCQKLISFIKAEYSMPNDIKEIISKYRIDNWIGHLFC